MTSDVGRSGAPKRSSHSWASMAMSSRSAELGADLFSEVVWGMLLGCSRIPELVGCLSLTPEPDVGKVMWRQPLTQSLGGVPESRSTCSESRAAGKRSLPQSLASTEKYNAHWTAGRALEIAEWQLLLPAQVDVAFRFSHACLCKCCWFGTRYRWHYRRGSTLFHKDARSRASGFGLLLGLLGKSWNTVHNALGFQTCCMASLSLPSVSSKRLPALHNPLPNC